jgi:hypothetical protein
MWGKHKLVGKPEGKDFKGLMTTLEEEAKEASKTNGHLLCNFRHNQ